MVTNWSVRLEKHQTIEILLMVDVSRFFKNVIFFKNFRDFSNSPVAPGLIVKCTYFFLIIVDQTQ